VKRRRTVRFEKISSRLNVLPQPPEASLWDDSSTRSPSSLASVVWKAVECVANGGAARPKDTARSIVDSKLPAGTTSARRFGFTSAQRCRKGLERGAPRASRDLL